MDFNIKPSVYWGVIISLTLLMFLMVNFVWPDDSYRTRAIDGDGSGYYDYLPTLVLNHSVDFKQTFNFEKANHPLDYLGHNFHRVGKGYINKFPVGTALMILPFFLIAHLLSPWFGLPDDGYSLLFQYEAALAALWWLWVGLFFLRKLLQSYHISDGVSFWIVLFTFTGTNLFYYAFVDVAFSHVYSFAAMAAFLFFTRELFVNYNLKWLALASFLLGWIVLIRPINILVLLSIPLLATNKRVFTKVGGEILGSFKKLSIIILMFLVAISPQLIINFLQTGKPVLYSYQGEGFYLFHPHISDFLFSFRKGWFVYTPLLLLLFPALLSLYKKSKYHFYALLLFILILVYIFSSWWNWFYGDGFGMRPMVDFYSLFALMIAWWVVNLSARYKKVLLFISFLFVGLNVVQSFQYFRGIIHVDSMTQKAYWHQFLRTADLYRDVVGSEDECFYGSLSRDPVIVSLNTFENPVKGWSKVSNLDSSYYFSPDHSVKFTDKFEFSSAFQYRLGDDAFKKKFYLKQKVYYYESTINAVLNTLFVVDIRDDSGRLIFYKSFPIKRLPDDAVQQWKPAHIGVILPRMEPGYIIKAYLWNKGKTDFFIDNMEVSLYVIH